MRELLSSEFSSAGLVGTSTNSSGVQRGVQRGDAAGVRRLVAFHFVLHGALGKGQQLLLHQGGCDPDPIRGYVKTGGVTSDAGAPKKRGHRKHPG